MWWENVEYLGWIDLRHSSRPEEKEDSFFASKFKSTCRKPVLMWTRWTRTTRMKNRPVGPFAGSIRANFVSIRQKTICLQRTHRTASTIWWNDPKIVTLLRYCTDLRNSLWKYVLCSCDLLPMRKAISRFLLEVYWYAWNKTLYICVCIENNDFLIKF